MIRIDGPDFKDEHGRTLLLRGVNLGGSSKVPFRPDGATYIREGFFNHRNVSFTGRPFPLAEADEHFNRLRAWGLTFIRFLVTWEAIEHAGPGTYDEEYLDYIRAIVQKAREHGLTLFIDPHEDVWSRFSGGDGAPGWTLEAVGFDITHFQETGAAVVHATHGDPFPRMVWPSNGSKLAAATMFTLFFAGNDFAPQTRISGEPAQEFLQRHFIQSIVKVAERLKGLDNVAGYDVINEPTAGYIGWKDLTLLGGPLLLGECPSPYQSMLLGDGFPQEAGIWILKTVSIDRTGTRLLNASRQRAWKDGHDCIWRENGVWDYDSAGQPQLLRKDYFARVDGREVTFEDDYYPPFALRFAEAIHAVDPQAMIFTEGEVGRLPPAWASADHPYLVYAPHWYDGIVMVSKNFSPLLGVDVRVTKPVFFPWNIRRSYAEQLAFFKHSSDERLGGAPVVLGEFGIPMDLGNKQAYRTGNFRQQEEALDRTFNAIEANLLHCTQWVYTSDNTNEHGDLWNDEDLSLFSRDQQKDPQDIYSGGRALRAALRPYPMATAGKPLHLSFDMRRRIFRFIFRHDPAIKEPSEIFVPDLHYPHGYHVQLSDGKHEVCDAEQKLLYWHSPEQAVHTITIKP